MKCIRHNNDRAVHIIQRVGIRILRHSFKLLRRHDALDDLNDIIVNVLAFDFINVYCVLRLIKNQMC